MKKKSIVNENPVKTLIRTLTAYDYHHGYWYQENVPLEQPIELKGSKNLAVK